MSSELPDAVAVIRGLKLHFGVESDEALSDRLGVAKSTIASWRRRGGVPQKVAREIETKHGLTITVLQQDTLEDYREYIIRYAFHLITMRLAEAYFLENGGADQASLLAENLAVIDPYLRRAIVRASSADRYRGVDGATSFLLDLRTRRINSELLLAEARAEREQELTGQP